MKKVIGIISLLLSVTLATANPIDFDKAFKESAKIEKQIKWTSFPKRTYLITDFGAQPDTPDEPCHEAINRAILTCSLNGGGLTKAKQLQISKGNFFIPVEVLRDKFKGKYLHFLDNYYQNKELTFSSSCKELRNSYK